MHFMMFVRGCDSVEENTNWTELTKSVVLPELIELSGDESGSVRLAAFETLVNMLDMFDTDSIRVGQNGNVYGCGKYTLLYSKEIFIVIKKLSLMIDNVVLNFKQFQKKNYEKDLLDQEKEREELLFLEMEQLEKEKHQNDGRSSSEKSFEKKHDSFRTRNASSLPASFSPNPVLPSTSRGTGNTADAKSSGSKDAPPRKATL
ncbi:Serine/threonine-protein phosphatase 4 regulatory subunit 4 [Cricetulus griseus]|uniref:Serine/threonine-protein phosphatase 4 regulatory subunit 4 n=1 Tax=Cricetulus griseus TaxID=10029 RepID=G3I292_CRIGR|nr:Serine/threonine-protein phosphatase 4 regulatory subunit 4 [Cricetulus griseus]